MPRAAHTHATVHADEAADWNALHSRFDTKRINHQTAFSLDGACTNAAESLFSRLRRAEIGHYHHLSGPYLDRYARETAFQEARLSPSRGTLDRRLRIPRRREESDSPLSPLICAFSVKFPTAGETYRPRGAAITA